MNQPIIMLLARLMNGQQLTKDEIGGLVTHYRYLYDDWNRQEAELITLREKVRLLRNENQFLTGLLQEE